MIRQDTAASGLIKGNLSDLVRIDYLAFSFEFARLGFMRSIALAITFASTALATVFVFNFSYNYFGSEELNRADGRLSLYRSTVTAELERFSHLTYVLARDPIVIATSEGGGTEHLDLRLREFADQAGLDAIYLMSTTGITISASNAGQSNSFVGQNYAFRPYFQTALDGKQGRFYGIGATTGLPGYFIAGPVQGDQGGIVGVIAIKIDLSKLQDSWRTSGENVLLANDSGVVLLSSDPSWRYRVLNPLSSAQRENIEASRQFPGQPLDLLDWEPDGHHRARINGDVRLHVNTTDLPHGWELHYFASDERAVALAWLFSAATVFLAILALTFYQVQRTRRIGRALKRSENEEAQLRISNKRLSSEIEDRRAAERRLKRTQNELESASRLAALGQLSASVTHELGQPIAAMRNHITAAEIGGKSDGSLSVKMGGLVERMEGITRQLKFFAQADTEEFGDVDLFDAVNASLALVTPNISDSDAVVDVQKPVKPVVVRGISLRLEQVLTNLLRNGLDAVEDCETRQLHVRLGVNKGNSWLEIEDSGHGLGEATLSDLQEPFVTTRESGRGMGLGLAISANIIKDHGGKMSAWNSETGGAIFRVEFPEMAAKGPETQ